MSGEPVIVAFLCNWCSYRGADQAGSSRLPYPANLRAVRVMCSGRVEPEFVLQAFAHGADGVLICGCHLGECHYITGNQKAAARHALLTRTLQPFGIAGDRVRLEWVSALEGEKFAGVVRDMAARLRSLGPLRLEHPPGVPEGG